MHPPALPTPGADAAQPPEKTLSVHMFRVVLGCALAMHTLYQQALSSRMPLLNGAVFALAVAIGLGVELGPRSLWRSRFESRHLLGMTLLGALYTVFLGAIVAGTGGSLSAAATWWLPLFPSCVILAGNLRAGIALLCGGLLWFASVRSAVALGVWVPVWPSNIEPSLGALAMLVATALLGYLMALSVRQRRDAHAALQQAVDRLAGERQQARAEANAKNLLLVNTTHEMRTPLNAVIGLAELLATSSVSPSQQREMLGLMRQSAGLLRGLADDVLDYAKLEAGRLTIERIEFPLRTTIFAIAHLFAPQAHAKGLEIGVCFGPDLPHRVTGDPLRLRQILANFASNAVKFTEAGGVQLCASVAAAGWIRVEVHDSGPGLQAQALTRLFQPFVQAADDTARRHGGSGLGLSISSRLAEQIAGPAGPRSTPGEGAVFWVELPLPTVPAESPYHYPQLPPMGQVWLVSANRFLHWTLSDMLKLRVDEVHPSSRLDDPRLAALPARSVVLVDAQALQSADDARAFDALAQRLRALGSLPVLLCTAISSAAPASITGAFVSLYKPVRLSQLLSALLQALDPLPEGERVAPAADDGAGSAPPLQGLRVLLAEDNPVNQMVASSMLMHLGAAVVSAENGRQTLLALAGQRFDLVLLDCEMPDLDGFEVASRWRETERHDGLPRTPMLAVTGHSRDQAWPRCQATGIDGFLAKPYFSDQLLSAIGDVRARAATAG